MTVLCLATAGASALALQPRLPAFPGAQGFGAATPGGRAGAVLLVTNLNDSGPGSLRAACEAPGPRVILFRVAGIIDLRSALRIRAPFVTIAGQTAPGDGVCIRGHALVIETHDVVVRFLRLRPGDIAGVETDGLAVGGESRSVVIDHCSVTWGIDENLSPSGAISDVTVQWCLVAESLNQSIHHKGAHGYGSLVRAAGGLTLHHNLWAHNHGRNPRLGDNYGRPPYPVFDVRNNVVYNPGSPSVVGDRFDANYVANYIKPGPSAAVARGVMAPTQQSQLRFFVSGNRVEGFPNLSKDPLGLFTRAETGGRRLVDILPSAFPAPHVDEHRAEDAYQQVLARCGATLPIRDSVDQRIVSDVRAGTGRIINSQRQVGSWPAYRSAPPPVDSDNDGMPDEWESAHGLNPRVPSDAADDRDGDGYTNIEEYLNAVAAAERRRNS